MKGDIISCGQYLATAEILNKHRKAFLIELSQLNNFKTGLKDELV